MNSSEENPKADVRSTDGDEMNVNRRAYTAVKGRARSRPCGRRGCRAHLARDESTCGLHRATSGKRWKKPASGLLGVAHHRRSLWRDRIQFAGNFRQFCPKPHRVTNIPTNVASNSEADLKGPPLCSKTTRLTSFIEGKQTLPTPAPPGNRLLARLPHNEFQRLRPHLQLVPLKFKRVLYEVRSPIDFAYFVNRGVVSALAVMEDGRVVEVATIGNEGVVALPAFLGVKTSPHKIIVQVPGDALRIKTGTLREEVDRKGPLGRLLVLYHTAFLTQISQSVACNGLHTVQQRCCRWLLMTHDRVDSDDILLTHEFLAVMLGVRGASVTEVLKSLQDDDLIRYSRGKITVLNREGLEATSCECYRTVKEEYARLFR